MGQSALSASLQTMQNIGEVVDTPEMAERDLNVLEKWEEKKLMKYNKGKCKYPWEWINPGTRTGWGSQMESSFTEKSPVGPGANRLTINQQCALMAKAAISFLGCDRDHQQQVEEGDPFPLLSTGEATSEVLDQGLGTLVQDRHGATETSPLKGY